MTEEEKEKRKLYKQQYYQKNKAKVDAKNNLWKENNKQRSIENQTKYRENNKDKLKQSQKDNYQKYKLGRSPRKVDKEKRKARDKKYIENKYKNNPEYRLRINISHVINHALKSIGETKRGKSIFDYLFYDLRALKTNIEFYFKLPGNGWMTWENYGAYDPKVWNDNDSSTWTWNLDHIVPHSLFNYTSMSDLEFQACWALENLRPYSSKQNSIDGSTRIRHVPANHASYMQTWLLKNNKVQDGKA